MKWKEFNICVKAFLIALIVPAFLYGYFIIATLQQATDSGFNGFNCNTNFGGNTQPCSMLKFLVLGWTAQIMFLASIIYFFIALICTEYTALVIFLKKRKSPYYFLAFIVGIVLFVLSIVGWWYLQARY